MSGGAAVVFDPIVEQGGGFSDEEENTSAEERADAAMEEADAMELELEAMMQDVQQEEAEEEEEEEEAPPKKEKKKEVASSKKGSSKKAPSKTKAAHPVIQAFGQMVEATARVAVFNNMERVHELMSGDIEKDTMRPEEVSFVETTHLMISTLESAILRISEHYEPVLRGIQERVANNEPMNHIITNILDASYVELYPLSPPKRKGVPIVDCFTGALFDGSDTKALKNTCFLFFLRPEEDPAEPSSYDGYYMSKTAGNLVRMTLTLKLWDDYALAKVSESIAQYRNTFLKDVTVLSSWDDIYAQLAQGFEKQPLKKWKQTQDVVQTGSFVHTIIELRRLLESTL